MTSKTHFCLHSVLLVLPRWSMMHRIQVLWKSCLKARHLEVALKQRRLLWSQLQYGWKNVENIDYSACGEGRSFYLSVLLVKVLNQVSPWKFWGRYSSWDFQVFLIYIYIWIHWLCYLRSLSYLWWPALLVTASSFLKVGCYLWGLVSLVIICVCVCYCVCIVRGSHLHHLKQWFPPNQVILSGLNQY